MLFPFALGVGTVGGSVAALVARHRYVTLQEHQDALKAETRRLLAKEQEILESMQQSVKVHQTAVADEQDKREFLATVWEGRREMYRDQDLSNRSYTVMLPEALSITSGLQRHYQHIVKTLPQFYQFDFLCSKLFSFAMLLHSTKEHGMKRTFDNWDFLFGSDPMVKEIIISYSPWLGAPAADVETDTNDNSASAAEECRVTLTELSNVFQYSRANLDKAVADAEAAQQLSLQRKSEIEEQQRQLMQLHTLQQQNLEVVERSSSSSRGTMSGSVTNAANKCEISPEEEKDCEALLSAAVSADITRSALGPIGSAALRFVQGFHKSSATHTKTKNHSVAAQTDETKPDVMMDEETAQKNQKIEQQLADLASISNLRLTDEDDVLAAIFHVIKLQQLFNPATPSDGDRNKTSSTMRPSPWVQQNEKVQRSLNELQLWRDAAEQFLVEEQAIRGLAAFHYCLNDSVIAPSSDASEQ